MQEQSIEMIPKFINGKGDQVLDEINKDEMLPVVKATNAVTVN